MSNKTFCGESDKLSFFSGSRGQRLADLKDQRSDANLARLKSDMARFERMMQSMEREIVNCDVLIAENSRLRACALKNKAFYLQNIAECEGYLVECVLELVSLVD